MLPDLGLNLRNVEMRPADVILAWRTLCLIEGLFDLGSKFGTSVEFRDYVHDGVCWAGYTNQQGEDCWLRHDKNHIVLCGLLFPWRTVSACATFAEGARSFARAKRISRSLLPTAKEAGYGFSFALYSSILGKKWKLLSKKRGSEVSGSLLTKLTMLRGPKERLDQWLQDEYGFKNAVSAATSLILMSPLTESIVKQLSTSQNMAGAVKIAVEAGYPVHSKLLAKATSLSAST